MPEYRGVWQRNSLQLLPLLRHSSDNGAEPVAARIKCEIESIHQKFRMQKAPLSERRHRVGICRIPKKLENCNKLTTVGQEEGNQTPNFILQHASGIGL